jgi:hypothetical protein
MFYNNPVFASHLPAGGGPSTALRPRAQGREVSSELSNSEAISNHYFVITN